MKQTLQEKVKLIKSGKLTATKNVADFGEKIEKLNKKLNIFLSLNTKALEQAKEIDNRIKQKKQTGKLAGLCFAVKSNISVKSMTTTCASRVLENYVSPYDATVIEKLKNEDAIIIGMTNMDEFACGWSGETSAFQPTKNPHNPELIPGGSSSGSAASVAADLCDFALGSDTGGSIRNPASHCGIVGFKPTYGSVSRYGLIDMAMSFDQIGPLTKNSQDAELIFNIIKGQDNFDTTTSEFKENKTDKKTFTLGLVDVSEFCDKKIADLIEKRANEIAGKNKWKIKKIKLPLDIGIETYYIMVFVEFFSATRKFEGRRFGYDIEEKAGPEVLRRIFGGSEISRAEYHGKFYRSALKASEYVKEKFNELFKDVDVIILPTVPRLAHKINETIPMKDMYAYDILTVLANIAQLPAVSVPIGELEENKVKKQVGIQLMADKFNDNLVLEIARKFE